MRGFNYKKAVQALNFLAIKSGGEINKMKAIKLIWLADRLHLRKFGRTITGDVYFALPHGPVPSTTRDILELNPFSLSEDEMSYSGEFLEITGRYDYRTIKENNLKVFSKTDIESLDNVFAFYGTFDHFTLRNISHKFPEWKRWKLALAQGISSRFQIDLRDFFKNDGIENRLFDEDDEDLKLIESLFTREDLPKMN